MSHAPAPGPEHGATSALTASRWNAAAGMPTLGSPGDAGAGVFLIIRAFGRFGSKVPVEHPESIEGYETPLHLSLTQPVLFGGVPRTFGILNVVLALVIALGLHVWWLGIPLGLIVHAAAMAMTRRDPQWFDVFRRHVRQPTFLDT